jgi:hypothetical protein
MEVAAVEFGGMAENGSAERVCFTRKRDPEKAILINQS